MKSAACTAQPSATSACHSTLPHEMAVCIQPLPMHTVGARQRLTRRHLWPPPVQHPAADLQAAWDCKQYQQAGCAAHVHADSTGQQCWGLHVPMHPCTRANLLQGQPGRVCHATAASTSAARTTPVHMSRYLRPWTGGRLAAARAPAGGSGCEGSGASLSRRALRFCSVRLATTRGSLYSHMQVLKNCLLI